MKTHLQALRVAVASVVIAFPCGELLAANNGPYPESESIGGPARNYSAQPPFSGYTVANGIVYGIRGQRAYPLSDSVTLTNNLRIDGTGLMTDGNGRVARLPENEMMTSDGRLTPTPPGVELLAPATDFSF